MIATFTLMWFFICFYSSCSLIVFFPDFYYFCTVWHSPCKESMHFWPQYELGKVITLIKGWYILGPISKYLDYHNLKILTHSCLIGTIVFLILQVRNISLESLNSQWVSHWREEIWTQSTEVQSLLATVPFFSQQKEASPVQVISAMMLTLNAQNQIYWIYWSCHYFEGIIVDYEIRVWIRLQN